MQCNHKRTLSGIFLILALQSAQPLDQAGLHSRLPDAKITEHLLSPSQDRIKLLRPLELLHKLAHPGLGERAATEDLDCIVGDLACESGALHFEESDLAGHLSALKLTIDRKAYPARLRDCSLYV